MTLYRCAGCGSSRVMVDKQTGGYSYSKGLLGSLLFGMGGAAAGVGGKSQTVYKCPDCGVTLTYRMPQEQLLKIERALIDPNFPMLEWKVLKAQYKNLEESVLGRAVRKDEESKKTAVNMLSHISETEFIALAKDVSAFLKKIGWFNWGEYVYDIKHLPPVDEYSRACDQIKKLISHVPQFMTYVDFSNSQSTETKEYEEYRWIFDYITLYSLIVFTMAQDYYKRTGQAMNLDNNEILRDYFTRNKHLKDLALRCGIIDDGRVMSPVDRTPVTTPDGGFLLLYGLKSYDPNKVFLNSSYSGVLEIRRDSELTLHGYNRKYGVGGWTCVFPQLVVEEGKLKINEPVFTS